MLRLHMFRAPLPDIPALYVHASVNLRNGCAISATGVGASPTEAELRHNSERAERIAQADLQQRDMLPWPPDAPAIAGIAAGTDDLHQIQNRASLELIERWTCQSWWHGAIPARQPAAQTRAAFATARKNWPRRSPRRTGLLQLGDPVLPPTCVAWSCDQAGRSLCFGTACKMDGPSAATAALRELYQMEFGLSVILHRQRGGIALSPPEQEISRRAKSLPIEALVHHFRAPDPSEDIVHGDINRCFSNAGIDLSLTRYPEVVDGHHVVFATSADLSVVSPANNQCDTVLRWNLYGA